MALQSLSAQTNDEALRRLRVLHVEDSELDHELKEKAEERGLEFYRVPVPHDDPRFIQLLADLIEPFITGNVEEAGFRPCRCRSTTSC